MSVVQSVVLFTSLSYSDNDIQIHQTKLKVGYVLFLMSCDQNYELVRIFSETT